MRLFEPYELLPGGETEGAVGLAIVGYEDVAAARADQVGPLLVRFVAAQTPVHEHRVAHVDRRGPGQQPRGIAVVSGDGAVDFVALAFAGRAEFVGDAAFEIAVGVAVEYDDAGRRKVAAA